MKPATIAQLIAKEFSRILKEEELGEQEFTRMVNRHLDEHYKHEENICVSHEFCDANMPMAQAFEKITGIEVDPMNEEHCKLWNRAWDYAKNSDFYAVIQIA